MIKHVVCLKFKPGVTEAQIKFIEDGFTALPDKISLIKEYSFGRDIVRSERSYDFALVSAFNSLEEMDEYRAHPDHMVILKAALEASDEIIAVDYEY